MLNFCLGKEEEEEEHPPEFKIKEGNKSLEFGI